MRSVVPTALVRFFGPSLTMEALLRNKTHKSFAANAGLRTKRVILRSFIVWPATKNLPITPVGRSFVARSKGSSSG